MFRCVKILLFPSDLIKASNRIQCASLFFAQLKGSQIKEKKKMPEITVTKGIELIITLNNHNFLFNYSHSTQWKLSFPPDFSLTFWTLKNYNNKTTTYRLAGCVFFLFNAKYKVYIVIFVFGVWHYFNTKDWDWKYLAIKKNSIVMKKHLITSSVTRIHYVTDMALSINVGRHNILVLVSI